MVLFGSVKIGSRSYSLLVRRQIGVRVRVPSFLAFVICASPVCVCVCVCVCVVFVCVAVVVVVCVCVCVCV